MQAVDSHFTGAVMTIAKTLVTADPTTWGTWEEVLSMRNRREAVLRIATQILLQLTNAGFITDPKESA